jgi:hypothetical protein
VHGERWDGLASSALFEREYQSLILQEAGQIFPDLRVLPFSEPVSYEGIWKKPDVALLDPRCRAWWVGEVELAGHPLNGHVLPQVEVLARGRYGERHVAALAAAAVDIDAQDIEAMLRGAQPKVVVIVNRSASEWERPLAREGALLVVVEVFQSPTHRPIFRIDGQEPAVPGDVLTTCHVDPSMPRLLRLDTPAALTPEAGEIAISHEGVPTRWHRFAIADRTYLSPVRGSPWPQGSKLRIRRRANGELTFDPET